jgi:hypothetical protein
MILDGLNVLRLAIGSQAHHFVLTRIDPEAGEIGESRIQEAERVRKALFLEDADFAPAPDAHR